jgi:lipopolysaccharide transport system ATP-binding protein
MSRVAVVFKNVGKSYPQYHHVMGGFKNFIFHLPTALRSFKSVRFEALRDISFEVQKGECIGLIGRNGAGKSTTLGLIAGVLKPTLGEVIVHGRISPLLELGAGFSHDLSGRENIFLNGILMGMTRKEVEEKEAEIVEFAELGDFIDQPIRIYSSGMMARLGFSVVSSLNPEILLVDEVLAVGDIAFQKKCIERMREFRKRGVTIILVSHALKSFEALCERIIWIENHTVKLIGTTREVIQAYSKAILDDSK